MVWRSILRMILSYNFFTVLEVGLRYSTMEYRDSLLGFIIDSDLDGVLVILGFW